MTEQLRESLSALMDDEANELELERVLSRIGQDSELRGTWVRYQAVRAATSGQGAASMEWDISGRVMASIGEQESPATAARWQRMLRPLGGFAVAASVAAVVVVGGQQWSQTQAPVEVASQSAAAPALGFVNTLGGAPVQASLGSGSGAELELTPAVRTAYHELARQRMLMYSQQHAEQAALNTPQGLIPYARVPRIEE
ncbi:sigma-E factor negative regulatory protein [Haliea atlantica]|nr:anti-anti-sigma factor [Haliea sp.]|tara:strand:- start:114364 stop:114960 length:597 start_codon:yes stop_codon:yes gene_type:complete